MLRSACATKIAREATAPLPNCNIVSAWANLYLREYVDNLHSACAAFAADPDLESFLWNLSHKEQQHISPQRRVCPHAHQGEH